MLTHALGLHCPAGAVAGRGAAHAARSCPARGTDRWAGQLPQPAGRQCGGGPAGAARRAEADAGAGHPCRFLRPALRCSGHGTLAAVAGCLGLPLQSSGQRGLAAQHRAGGGPQPAADGRLASLRGPAAGRAWAAAVPASHRAGAQPAGRPSAGLAEGWRAGAHPGTAAGPAGQGAGAPGRSAGSGGGTPAPAGSATPAAGVRPAARYGPAAFRCRTAAVSGRAARTAPDAAGLLRTARSFRHAHSARIWGEQPSGAAVSAAAAGDGPVGLPAGAQPGHPAGAGAAGARARPCRRPGRYLSASGPAGARTVGRRAVRPAAQPAGGPAPAAAGGGRAAGGAGAAAPASPDAGSVRAARFPAGRILGAPARTAAGASG